MNWWIFAVTVGATTRLTRLITHDDLTAGLRRYAARLDARSRLAMHRPPIPTAGPWLRFVTCPWCVSVWVGFALFGVYAVVPTGCRHALAYAYAALTASLVAAVVLVRHELAVERPPTPRTRVL